jgi:hypothetical protein
MSGKVYFGNASKQAWVKSPSSGMRASTQGWMNEQQLLNGMTFVKRSQGSHRRFEMSWFGSANSEDLSLSLNTIKDFCDGVYGDGPFFWNDPFATRSNMFSPAWAAPALSVGTNWTSICPDGVGVTKETVTTSSISSLVGNNTYNYPANTAKFTAPGNPNLESNKFTFYIPTGFTLWVGMHGHHGTTGAAYLKPYKAGVAGTPVQVTALGVNTATRVNTQISSSTADKVEFYIAKIAPSPCVFHIAGLVAQLLPTGQSPDTGAFISGRGTGALEFTSYPQIEYYSSEIGEGQIGLSITMAEI